MYMEFYKLNHEVNKKDLERFSYPNQKLGVIIHVENERERFCFNNAGQILVMKMACLKTLVEK